jgi:hypothetical protein
VLAAKSLFDLQEWAKAIYSHIETLAYNQNLLRNQRLILQKEKELALRDQNQIVKTLAKLKKEVTNSSSLVTLLTNQAL